MSSSGVGAILSGVRMCAWLMLIRSVADLLVFCLQKEYRVVQAVVVRKDRHGAAEAPKRGGVPNGMVLPVPWERPKVMGGRSQIAGALP